MAKHASHTIEVPKDTPRKPLIFERNPLDEEYLDEFEQDYKYSHFDASYVPVYSERRIENQIRARDGKPLLPLPRLEWVRISKRGGQTVTESDEGMVEWLRLGYRACGVDDLEAFGFGFPPAAHVGSDGLIRRGDVALFVVADERAERNRIRQKRINEEFASREVMSGDTGEVYEVKKDRVKTTASLKELANTALPSLTE